jgi:hypothetical protein
VDEVRADEAGASGNEQAHRAATSAWSGELPTLAATTERSDSLVQKATELQAETLPDVPR